MLTAIEEKRTQLRQVAKPGGKDYGALGIIIQATCEVQEICKLAPTCFWPAPKVQSSVILLTRKAIPATDDLAKFADMLHLLFGKRRKQIGTIIGRDQALPEGVTHQMRPETLSLEQLSQLCSLMG